MMPFWFAILCAISTVSFSAGVSGPGFCMPPEKEEPGWIFAHWIKDIVNEPQYISQASVRSGDSNNENFFFIGTDLLNAIKNSITHLEVCYGSTKHCEQTFCHEINYLRTDQNWECSQEYIQKNVELPGLVPYLSGACDCSPQGTEWLTSCNGDGACGATAQVPWSCSIHGGTLANSNKNTRDSDFKCQVGVVSYYGDGLSIFPYHGSAYEIATSTKGNFCDIDLYFVRVKTTQVCSVDLQTVDGAKLGPCPSTLVTGQSCTAICADGYSVIGDPTYSCAGSALTPPAEFSCQAMECNITSMNSGHEYSYSDDADCSTLKTGGNCNQTCIDGYKPAVSDSGIYTCSAGVLEGTILECTDIDECLSDVCLNMDGCVNSDGNYSCTCPMYYSGDNVNTACSQTCPENYIEVTGEVPCACAEDFDGCGWDETTGSWIEPTQLEEGPTSSAPSLRFISASTTAIMFLVLLN